MLTPQEVSERVFPKASFGGYNMAQVDEFLDLLTEDYSTLYSENAVLKSKMKVLVDKVEEYRSTENAMRKALMTAQRMAEVDMAGPYYYATIVVLTTKNSQYANAQSIADLAGGKCTSQSGTIWYDSCLPQIENAQLLAPAESAPTMIMQLETGAVDFVCTDMPTAMAAAAKNDELVILNFSGTDGDFQFATDEERAENVNIGIAVQKGNDQLREAIDRVLSALNEEQFNALMDQAIAIQPEV